MACLANTDLPEEEAEHAATVQAQGWSPTATVVNDTVAILRSGLTDRVEGPAQPQSHATLVSQLTRH